MISHPLLIPIVLCGMIAYKDYVYPVDEGRPTSVDPMRVYSPYFLLKLRMVVPPLHTSPFGEFFQPIGDDMYLFHYACAGFWRVFGEDADVAHRSGEVDEWGTLGFIIKEFVQQPRRFTNFAREHPSTAYDLYLLRVSDCDCFMDRTNMRCERRHRVYMDDIVVPNLAFNKFVAGKTEYHKRLLALCPGALPPGTRVLSKEQVLALDEGAQVVVKAGNTSQGQGVFDLQRFRDAEGRFPDGAEFVVQPYNPDFREEYKIFVIDGEAQCCYHSTFASDGRVFLRPWEPNPVCAGRRFSIRFFQRADAIRELIQRVWSTSAVRGQERFLRIDIMFWGNRVHLNEIETFACGKFNLDLILAQRLLRAYGDLR